MTDPEQGQDGGAPSAACGTRGADYSGVTRVQLRPGKPLADYREAMRLAGAEAGRRLGECMLLSWYDRDRDFEAPQHVSECHADSAVPGYVDYGINHGATLEVTVEDGRFVFFYLPLNPELVG